MLTQFSVGPSRSRPSANESPSKKERAVLNVQFKAYAELAENEVFIICGSLPQLGSWNPDRAPRMAREALGSGCWMLEVVIPTQALVEFKLVLSGPADIDMRWIGLGESEANIIMQTGHDAESGCRFLSEENLPFDLSFVDHWQMIEVSDESPGDKMSIPESDSKPEREDVDLQSESGSTRQDSHNTSAPADTSSCNESDCESDSKSICLAPWTGTTLLPARESPTRPLDRYPGIYAAESDLDLNLPMRRSLSCRALPESWHEARSTWELGFDKHQFLRSECKALGERARAAVKAGNSPSELARLQLTCLELRARLAQALEDERPPETRDLEHRGQGRTSGEMTLVEVNSQLRDILEQLRECSRLSLTAERQKESQELQHRIESAVFEGALHARARLALPTSKVPVFMMLPLDWAEDDAMGIRNEVQLKAQLECLKRCGVVGVMADVWWALSEPAPGEYRFGAVLRLCALLRELRMELQATMSFHRCGGNIGDNVKITLPAWVLEVAADYDLFYRGPTGDVSEDCLSLSADSRAVLPGPNGAPRTALTCYGEFMTAFAKSCSAHIGGTIIEMQVGMGPCGELRYPSYMMSKGWCYPGVGNVMANDSGMQKMLSDATGMTAPPDGLPASVNSMPEDAALFRVAWRQRGGDMALRQGAAKVFFEWYTHVLLEHGQLLLHEAAAAMDFVDPGKKLSLSVKVSGIHWWVQHPTRSAELCAGYNCCTSATADAYVDIAEMLTRAAEKSGRQIALNFTCLEMTTMPNDELSDPEGLIAQVRRACTMHNVPLCGENALGFDMATGSHEFSQMQKQIRSWSRGPDRMERITLLRLEHAFNAGRDPHALRQFIASI